MSDTVKLVIEIPKPMYECVKNKTYCGSLYPYLENGTPLDDVKAEINKQEFTHHQGLTHWYMTPSEVKSIVFGILDNIGKAEKGGE